ncbi:MAG TPA: hypothetical protein VME92_19905 [Acetobacteraceae bacterium]|nr:hypothetical protein [Acetobacteraceae bacterium]
MNRTLIEAAVALADTLQRENAALEALDLPRATALLPEKTAATARFVALQEAAATAAASPDVARAVAHRLQRAATENRRLLERAMLVQGRVIETVARAARSQAQAPRYGARGTLAADRRAAPLALSARA